MGKVIVFNLMSINGVFEAADPTLDWFNIDDEFNEFALNQLRSVDILLFGRQTYDGMYAYWTSDDASDNNPEFAKLMNTKKKIVFSKKMEKPQWEHTTVIKDNIKQQIHQLKDKEKKDLIIFGSADLVSTFLKLELIDEIRIMISPIILGSGKPLFKEIQDNIRLKLMESRVLNSGNILLNYEVH